MGGGVAPRDVPSYYRPHGLACLLARPTTEQEGQTRIATPKAQAGRPNRFRTAWHRHTTHCDQGRETDGPLCITDLKICAQFGTALTAVRYRTFLFLLPADCCLEVLDAVEEGGRVQLGGEATGGVQKPGLVLHVHGGRFVQE